MIKILDIWENIIFEGDKNLAYVIDNRANI